MTARSAAAASPVGAHAARQAQGTARRFLREARHFAEAARQDEAPLLAMLHNAEGLAHTRCALRLAEEHGGEIILYTEDVATLLATSG